jgi:hypothetical protein
MRGAAILAPWLLSGALLLAGCGQVADAQGALVATLRIKAAVGDYEKSHTPTDRCVKARLVAVAYADARDKAETEAWQAREQEDCRAAAASLGVTLPARAAKP